MGLFHPNTEKELHQELAALKELSVHEKLTADGLIKIREWLTSINTRLKQGTLKQQRIKPFIHEIKKILSDIEKEQEKERYGVKKISNIMLQLSKA